MQRRAPAPGRGRRLALLPLDPLDHGAHRGGFRSALVDASEGAELLEGAGERLEQRLAVLAAREVAVDASAGACTEVALEVVGQAVARLATGRHPGLHEQAQHFHLDAEAGPFVSGSYDLRVAPGEQTDAELVRLAQEGDLDAFAEIVRRHERRLRIVLLRILDDTRDVEEAVQDAFVQAWRNLDRYRAEAALFTWLYRIGVNAALAHTRRKRLPTSGLDSLPDEGARHVAREVLPEPAAEAQDARTRVLGALAQLPFEYREAVVLRDLAGLSNEEVATALDVSLAAAKSRIHRGRLRLRELLEPGAGH
jgi:RNA polymerase sigma-70 factor (ECF subfamily)